MNKALFGYGDNFCVGAGGDPTDGKNGHSGDASDDNSNGEDEKAGADDGNNAAAVRSVDGAGADDISADG